MKKVVLSLFSMVCAGHLSAAQPQPKTLAYALCQLGDRLYVYRNNDIPQPSVQAESAERKTPKKTEEPVRRSSLQPFSHDCIAHTRDEAWSPRAVANAQYCALLGTSKKK